MIADRQVHREPASEDRAGEEDFTSGVDAVEDGAIVVVGGVAAEVHYGEGRGGGALEAGVGVDPCGELPGHGDVVADDGGEALAAVGAEDEPELQGAEAAAEGDTVV